jgi:hexosaminidase
LNLVTSDESYSLTVDKNGNCAISSATVWGTLYGMETFSQLLVRQLSSSSSSKLAGDVDFVYLGFRSIDINDTPRFAHRGLLIDTARHFLPVASIKSLIDSMPMNKLNVLHWHVVDAESFPLNVRSIFVPLLLLHSK